MTKKLTHFFFKLSGTTLVAQADCTEKHSRSWAYTFQKQHRKYVVNAAIVGAFHRAEGTGENP